MDGPGGQLQLYVRVDVELLEDEVYIKGAAVQRGDKQLKNVSADDLTKLRRRMLANHDAFGEATPIATIPFERNLFS